MNAYSLTRDDVSELRTALKSRVTEYDGKLAEVRRVLSELTRYASVSMTPKLAPAEALRRIDIVPCDPQTCVVVAVTGVGTVKSKLCRLSAGDAAEVPPWWTPSSQSFRMWSPAG